MRRSSARLFYSDLPPPRPSSEIPFAAVGEHPRAAIAKPLSSALESRLKARGRGCSSSSPGKTQALRVLGAWSTFLSSSRPVSVSIDPNVLRAQLVPYTERTFGLQVPDVR